MICALAGSTGLVGRECLLALLAKPQVQQVVSVSRKPTGVSDAKLTEILSGFDVLSTEVNCGRIDVGLCALGTTIKVAGSHEAFRKVDHEYIVTFARWCKAQGARRFVLVSAIGADASSRFFYNRVKGETESAVRALQFESLTILRPSLLLGARHEFRMGEKLGEVAMGWLRPLLPKSLRPIAASDVAQAMVRAALEADKETFKILTYAEIRVAF